MKRILPSLTSSAIPATLSSIGTFGSTRDMQKTSSVSIPRFFKLCDRAADQIAIQTIGQVAAIEPVGPLPQVAREMLGADPMMGADQPGFDVAEQRVDDREELAGIGAVVLDHRGVFQE